MHSIVDLTISGLLLKIGSTNQIRYVLRLHLTEERVNGPSEALRNPQTRTSLTHAGPCLKSDFLTGYFAALSYIQSCYLSSFLLLANTEGLHHIAN